MSGLERIALPTARKARGLPASAASWPYVATFPLGMLRASAYIFFVNGVAIAGESVRERDARTGRERADLPVVSCKYLRASPMLVEAVLILSC